jgi:hypothetical protein
MPDTLLRARAGGLHGAGVVQPLEPRSIGRYRLGPEIGRGMMGVVYEALDPMLERTVALKTVATDLLAVADRERFEQRFFAEARAAARLSHRGIVVVHDVGRDPETGALFIALERLRGVTLGRLVEERGRLPWPEALRIVASLARALDHAHERGIVHRDVKPDNVMILDSGDPKIMDFGVARLESSQLTGPGHVFGTPRYMAPEQALGEAVDGRSDLFALGSVAYLLLTGRHAFGAPSVPVVLQQVISDDPVPPSSLVPGVPATVDELVRRALAKAPAARYQRGRELAEDAEDILAGRLPRHLELEVVELADGDLLLEELTDELGGAPLPPRPASVEQQLAALTESTLRETRRRPWHVAVAATALLAAVGFAWPRGTGDGATEAVPLPSAAVLVAQASSQIAPPAVDAPFPATRASASRPTAASEGPARVRVRLDHSLKQGRVRVWAGDRLLLEDTLRGREKRHLGLFRRTRGSFQRVVELAPGSHRLRVEVSWDDGRRTTSVTGRFAAGSSRQVSLQLDGSGRNLTAKIS